VTTVIWGFLDREVEVNMLGDRVAYSWTCGDSTHDHRIECLWVWHDCTMELDSGRGQNPRRSDESIGWGPAGVAAHDLISSSPLHIEASVYWPACCGLHGWIREGKWVDAG
jgi:hypothetical protein